MQQLCNLAEISYFYKKKLRKVHKSRSEV